jgi:hypothetical protein
VTRRRDIPEETDGGISLALPAALQQVSTAVFWQSIRNEPISEKLSTPPQ